MTRLEAFTGMDIEGHSVIYIHQVDENGEHIAYLHEAKLKVVAEALNTWPMGELLITLTKGKE